MKLTIEIKCDNAAFDDSPRREIARILKDYLIRIEHGLDLEQTLNDANGNKVGKVTLTDKYFSEIP